MRLFQRRAGILILFLALVTAPIYVLAQDNNTINVTGSGIVAGAFNALATASGTTAALNVTINGTNAGLDAFCTSSTDIALANRPLNEVEGQQCAGSNVNYLELLIGYDATAFIVAKDNTYIDCLTSANLNTLFAPSAAGQTTTWDQVNAEFTANPLSVVLPAANSFAYARLDDVVAGEGFRVDAASAADDAAVITAVAANPDAIGIVNLNSVLSLNAGENAGVHAVAYQNDTLNTCVAPTVETLEDRTYPLSNRLFLYVNTASLTKTGLNDLLTYMVGDTAGGVLST
ncbi:MAG TPA: substrate-binding domain-containing protein, partial [Phototrophicaceae bacterium]|nr:substrate-binding domain-containing protein [Phototrophicaceae bacterium]